MLLRSFTRTMLLLTVLASSITACGPARPAVPPGEIPTAPPVTPEDEDYGQQVLGQLTQRSPLERNDNYINRTRDIVDRLAKAARADRAPWHVYVLSGDKVVNAAATRGNYVFVWTGMLLKAASDGELATVLAHEVGHVLAGHTMPTPEEETAKIMAEVSGQVVSGVLSQTEFGVFADLAGMLVESAIAAMVVNPASQSNETEADHIGLFLMSDAGYNPHDAISLWTKMAQDPSASDTLSFLSSHPTSETRLQDLQTLLPEAMLRYDKSTKASKERPKSGNQTGGKSKPSREKGSHTKPIPTSKPTPSTPSATKSKQPTQTQTWIVAAEGVVVRTDPNEDAPAVATLAKRTAVVVEFTLGDWYKISAPSSGFVKRSALLSPTPS